MSAVVPPRKTSRHECELPDWRDLEIKTAAKCSGCGRWAYFDIADTGMGGCPMWFGVHWWHFRIRSRIRTAEINTTTPTEREA